MKNILSELLVAIAFLALLFVLANPVGLFMPDYVAMALLAALVVLFGIFASFLWREKGGDERERLHRMFSDRVAFLTGSAILLAGVVAGELGSGINPWILFTLAAMIVAKTAGLIYTKVNL